jgi:hypothetical protein
MNHYTDGQGMFWRVLPTGVVQTKKEGHKTWLASCYKSEAQIKRQPFMRLVEEPKPGRPKVETKKVVANISIDHALLARVKKAAKKDNKSTSALIAMLLNEALS